MIELRGVGLAYGRTRVLHDIHLRITANELVVLAGPNGVGKSTLLRAIAGLRPIAAGSIDVDGTEISAMSGRQRGRTLALIEADGPLPEHMTVDDVVAGGRLPYRPWWRWSSTAHDRAAIDKAIAATDIAAFAQRPFSELSSGERQRVWLAQAVAQQTPILLLDEPTSHLDIRHTYEMLTLVRGLVGGGKTAVVVLHDLNLAAAFADRIALLGDAKLLAFDTPQHVFDEALLSRVYGIPIGVRREPSGALFAFAAPPLRTR